MNPQTMTLDEVRDELAKMDGWKHIAEPTDEWDADTRSITMYPEHWIHASTNDVAYCHPHPATLDGAAAALPKGWYVEVAQYCTPPHTWYAYARRTGQTCYRWGPEDEDGECDCIDPNCRGNDEIITRYRLALACRIAEMEGAE